MCCAHPQLNQLPCCTHGTTCRLGPGPRDRQACECHSACSGIVRLPLCLQGCCHALLLHTRLRARHPHASPGGGSRGRAACSPACTACLLCGLQGTCSCMCICLCPALVGVWRRLHAAEPRPRPSTPTHLPSSACLPPQVSLRQRAGIQADSKLEILAAEHDMYVARINGNVTVKLGPRYDMGNLVPPKEEGWAMAASGKDFAVWEKQ